MIEGATPIVPPFALVWASREENLKRFGPPHESDPTPLPDPPGPTDWWAFRFPCGLEVVLEYPSDRHRFAERELELSTYADAIEIDHVLRHLAFDPESTLWRITDPPASEPPPIKRFHWWYESYRRALHEPRPRKPKPLLIPDPWDIWRRDDNGNCFLFSTEASKRAALCRITDLEAGGHKQHYWATKR